MTMDIPAKPKVLIVYWTFSRNTERVADVIGDALERRGAAVTKARIEFTDPRWAGRFETIPMRFPLLKILGMLPAQIRQATGEIRIPLGAQRGDYDLIIIGSPTWWFRLSLPMRSFLKAPIARKVFDGTPFAGYTTSRRYWKQNIKDMKRLGLADGGEWVGQTHFVAAGNQVQSMVSWLSFMSGFTYLNRILRLPPTNLQADFEDQARRFAEGVAQKALGAGTTRAATAETSATVRG
jgi:menaquinone-dependent protoporphyrinogen IX oxidase